MEAPNPFCERKKEEEKKDSLHPPTNNSLTLLGV
jgi:hypothetical protein